MKYFITKTPYLITFFILLIIRPYFYGLLIPKKDIIINNINNNMQKVDTEKYIYGTLLYQNPYQYNEELIIAIDDSKVQINDYVINEKGLLGVIAKKNNNIAIVKMLTSKKLILQVQINECYGLLKDSLITNVDAHCIVNDNDIIYTSNLGYVKDKIKIGKVSKVINDDNKIANSYEITFFNNEIIPETVIVIRGVR